MADKMVSDRVGATLVGGGPVLQGDLEMARAIAPLLVAADGGADTVLEFGQMPDWTIGDLDSISRAARDRIGAERMIHDTCQMTTDFEKSLSRIAAPLVLGLGFLGGQVDHELAALGALARKHDPVVLIGARDVVTHVSVGIDLALDRGARCSLFPMAPVRGRSEGLEWPIEGLDFAPGGQIGTSNRVTGPVRLRFDGPGMLLILPRAALAPLLAALG
ncbi:thiamine diphosphokinase [Oceaniglobus trochenteri]|uniref:thiamine diphosphokinase n=1 Tax=Oceaniglobus trochenteri TaxID=2763260 RepID=UPI001CFFCE29|nr:thiamine diphosphokinase [Oceaniglobus trochenteri]